MASDVYFFKTTTKTENSDRGFIPDTREKFVCNTKTTFDDDCRVFDFVMLKNPRSISVPTTTNNNTNPQP